MVGFFLFIYHSIFSIFYHFYIFIESHDSWVMDCFPFLITIFHFRAIFFLFFPLKIVMIVIIIILLKNIKSKFKKETK